LGRLPSECSGFRVRLRARFDACRDRWHHGRFASWL